MISPGILTAAGGGLTYATWDPSKGGALTGVTLSSANKTCSQTGTGTKSVLSTIGKNTGKWYWEVNIDSVGASSGVNLGISNANSTYAYALGTASGAVPTRDSYGWFVQFSTNQLMKHNGVDTVFGGSPVLTAGQTIGFALDMDSVTRTLAIYKNNSLQGTISGLAVTTWYAAVSRFSNNNTFVYSGHFTAASLVYTPPVGYEAGLYS